MEKKKAKKAARQGGRVIHVTQDDIDTALRNTSSHCMIAEAIKRQYGGSVTAVSVDLQTIRFSEPAKRLRFIYYTPPAAQIALLDFDAGIEMHPFSFRLRPPSQITPMSVKRKRPPIPKSITKSGGGTGGSVTVLGGKTPPIGPLAGGDIPGPEPREKKRRDGRARIGRRREFGLNSMGERGAA